MKYTINKQIIIEEADLRSQMLRSKVLTKATQNQNSRLGTTHPTTKRNLEIMTVNSKKPLQENAAMKIGAVGVAGKGLHLGIKALKKKVDDVDGFGAMGSNVKAINKAVDEMH